MCCPCLELNLLSGRAQSRPKMILKTSRQVILLPSNKIHFTFGNARGDRCQYFMSFVYATSTEYVFSGYQHLKP